jgi:hypothetical protein
MDDEDLSSNSLDSKPIIYDSEEFISDAEEFFSPDAQGRNVSTIIERILIDIYNSHITHSPNKKKLQIVKLSQTVFNLFKYRFYSTPKNSILNTISTCYIYSLKK